MVGSALDIPGSVAIMEGREGLPMVKLTHTSGASAEVYLFGGVCTSWTVDGACLALGARAPGVAWQQLGPLLRSSGLLSFLLAR